MGSGTNEIEKALFENKGGFPDSMFDGNTLLEQYKIYTDSMEKLVSRRQTAHSVFLTANAFLLSVGGFIVKSLNGDADSVNIGLALVAIAIPGILLSILWFKLSRYYGLMNSAKFEVIHALEARLPASLFLAEWVAVGEGKDPGKYQSMAKVESVVSTVFLMCYLSVMLFSAYLVFT